MDISGKVHFIGGTEVVGSSNFQKRLLVLDITEKVEYPNFAPIEFTQKSTEKLAGLNVGDDVTVQVNVRGREYGGKWYSNLQGWRVQVNAQQGPGPSPIQSGNATDDDIPF